MTVDSGRKTWFARASAVASMVCCLKSASRCASEICSPPIRLLLEWLSREMSVQAG